MNFNYQFVTQFIFKNNEYSRNLLCITYSSDSANTLYLYQTVGNIISEFGLDRLSDLYFHLDKISQNYSNHELGYLFNDLSGVSALLFQGDKTKILDLIHTDSGVLDGIQGPINYNISTPVEYQFLNTDLVIKVFKEWIDFILLQNQMTYVPTNWIKDEYINKLSE